MKKIFALSILCVFISSISLAADPIADLTDLKSQLQSEKNNESRFHLEAKMAKIYASIALTEAIAKDGESLALNLLKLSETNKKNWDYGNAIHHANLVLGRVKLFHKDSASAKRYLDFAAKTSGSPQLHSFGPNMTLAKELLLKGERAAVLKYFDDCAKFWKSASAAKKIADWKLAIAKNRVPAFRGNLLF